MRLAEHNNTDESRSLDEITRTMLSINPNDSNALFFAAATSRGNIVIAKNILKKLEGTTSYLNTAFNVVSSNRDDVVVLDFLKNTETTPAIAMLKLRAIAGLIKSGSADYKWVNFKTLALREGSFENIKDYLNVSDASFSAHWARTFGALFVEADDLDTAKSWLDYGLTRDPNNDYIQALALALSKPPK
jgi:hypothetical protein